MGGLWGRVCAGRGAGPGPGRAGVRGWARLRGGEGGPGLRGSPRGSRGRAGGSPAVEAAPGPALWERALGVVGFQNPCGGCGSPFSGGGGSSAALFLRKPWVCGEDCPPWKGARGELEKPLQKGYYERIEGLGFCRQRRGEQRLVQGGNLSLFPCFLEPEPQVRVAAGPPFGVRELKYPP